MDLCVVTKNGEERHAHVLERRPREVYVHYVNTDKRLDEWVSESAVRPAGGHEEGTTNNSIPAGAGNRKRKRRSVEREVLGSRAGSELSGGVRGQEGESSGAVGGHAAGEGGEGQGSSTVAITEEEYDIEHHKQITAKRNFDKVNFGRWQIKTWYFSPYPLTETEIEEQVSTPSAHGPPSNARIPGVARSTLRSHGRTSDLLAGGLGRSHGAGEKSMLWVCDKCFKYMSEGLSWELHVKKCTFKHPPGRKVYQRGAHIIWEVDGAKDKEKLSYDDYNLACIVVLPPYQKKGYGMLLIEFSYELSRRAGKVGTPERPLSDLGLRSYLTYWISTIVRFLRRLLSVLPADTQKVITTGSSLENSEVFTPSSPSRDEESGPAPKMKRRKSTKGWDGEDPAARFTDTLEITGKHHNILHLVIHLFTSSP
ncbi:hypothetical protein NLI96_g2173 [Meripilus lineatus]|uniref:MYST-type HAT domain-containing protein n=1 Tax=Meripilus lineatus TaxID=2056292 RepID=A0AAD5YM59_9APHY|nr:hypothetical protein NLI96_g2173 [Physisporinus lineatus]